MPRALRDEDLFSALAHPVRRRMLEMLREGERPASDLARPFGVSLPAISQQLNVLKRVGLVADRAVGKQRIYQLNPAPLREVFDWVHTFESFWAERLDALGEHLRRKHGPPK
jgi:DNA-binding transcriptional ArsR family regulator